MGEVSSPPYFYYIFEASKVLGCSFMDLFEHEEREDLISLAFAYKNGVSEGESALKENPKFKRYAEQERKKHG